MQLPTKAFGSQPNKLLNKKTIIIALVVLWLVGAIFIQIRKSQQPKLSPGEQGKYYDERSGETVSDPPGWKSETYGSASNEPVYLGLSKLISYGITQDQLSATKQALRNYAKRTNQTIKEISLETKSITLLEVDPNDTEAKQALGFNLQFNRKDTLNARLEYYKVSLIRLYLLDNSGKTVFDSGALDGAQPHGE